MDWRRRIVLALLPVTTMLVTYTILYQWAMLTFEGVFVTGMGGMNPAVTGPDAWLIATAVLMLTSDIIVTVQSGRMTGGVPDQGLADRIAEEPPRRTLSPKPVREEIDGCGMHTSR
jgi:hypothetical protein